jgi:hypothetical protein
MTVAQPKAALRILPADRVSKARSAWMMAIALRRSVEQLVGQ